MVSYSRRLATLFFCTALGAPVTALAEKNTDLLIGISLPLSGPVSTTGKESLAIVQAQIDQANRSGGIAGRKLRLLAMDDGFEPARAADNARKLAADGALALASCWGTANCSAMAPVAQQVGIALVGGLSGSGPMREQPGRWVFNLRASTRAEVGAMLQQMDSLGQQQFAVVYQQDAFGRSALQTAKEVFASRKAQPLKELALAPDGSDAAAIAQALAQEPGLNGVVLFASTPATVALITQARQRSVSAQFYNLAAQANRGVIQGLDKHTAGAVFTTLVPNPWRSTIGVVKEYQQLLAGMAEPLPPSYAGMEVFLNTRTLLDGLRKAGTNPSRESVVAGLEQLGDIHYGPMSLRFSGGQRGGSGYVGLAMIGQRGQFLE